MGTTSQVIEWGIDHGLEGPLEYSTRMCSRVGDYLLPYLDGYAVGFRLRKVGVKPGEDVTEESWKEEKKLYRLMTFPRYKRKGYM